MTTLIEAHERFAATLDDLRRGTVRAFEAWLRPALERDADVAQLEAQARIATARRIFSDDFLDQRAPAIIRALNRDAEFDVLKELRTYEARPQTLARAPSPTRGWMPSLWRTVLAAAFGAVAGVIVLTMQVVGEAPITREATVRHLLAASFAAALGAALGVILMACPPLHVLMERVGMKGAPARLARNFGATLLIFRIGSAMVLIAALLSGFFMLLAWLLGGSKPLHVAVGMIAVAVVLLARWTMPQPGSPDAIGRELVARLDDSLRADADVWAALAAALALRPIDGGGAPQAGITDITNLILARRAQNEAGEDILQVVEQQLGLPAGPTAPGRRPADVASEFVWKPEHTQVYSTFGIVEAGDTVTVSAPPLFVEDRNGRRVSQKGLVIRKRQSP